MRINRDANTYDSVATASFYVVLLESSAAKTLQAISVDGEIDV